MSHFDRRSVILGDLDVRTSMGLEIGPKHNPLVRKSDGVVFYIDHADTEFIKKANDDPLINNDDIVDIDIISGDRPLKELVPQPMDYVVASHVIEHVPDMIGWLLDLHGALKEDGLICLAVPDRRFTYDLHRPESTIGELVEAYLLRARRPPARHLFDKVALYAAYPKAQAWEDDMTVQLPPPAERLPEAYRLAERVASNTDYVDTHCWVFTPESFLDVADQLARLGLFPFAIEYFHPTVYRDYEFYARLRKSEDPAAVAASIQSARNLLKNAPTEQAYREMLLEKVHAQKLPEPSYGHSLRELEHQRKHFEDEQHRFQHELDDLSNQRRQLVDQQRRLQNEIRSLQSMMEKIKTSTSWRVTWPLRLLGRVLQSTRLTRKFLYNPLRRRV
ncbi:MAG: methyltransferase domain-containing protein [Thermoguttaceae bacterium]